MLWAESACRGECPPIGLADGQVVVDRNGEVTACVPAAATFPWWKPVAGGTVSLFDIDVSRNHYQVAGDVVSEGHSLSLRPLRSTHIPRCGKWGRGGRYDVAAAGRGGDARYRDRCRS